MKTISFLLLIIAGFLCSTQLAEAHAVWIESAAGGTKAKPHPVRIYYGEYEAKVYEKTADWYSDLREMEVYLLRPDQSKVKLTLTDKGEYLETTFTPDQAGVYLISASHATKDLGETTRYEFTSQVAVSVGTEAGVKQGVLPYQLFVLPVKHSKGSKVDILLTKDGRPLAGQDIVVMSPEGWTKTYQSDAQGRISTDVLWKGVYVAEFGHSTEVKGTWHGQPYTQNWQGLTTSFEVE